MEKIYKALSLTFLFFVLISFVNQKSFAANTTMGFSPASGIFDKAFTVSLVIDGNGDKFNAAQATIDISSNLAIQDLTYGDCNFSFLKTPSIQNPSFEGIIAGSYSTKCTVYTLTLIPTVKGNGTINLSKATVRRYGDAQEVLSSTQNGVYTLSAALQPPTIVQMKSTSQDGLYTLYFKVSGSNNQLIPNATVILNQISSKNQQQGVTDSTGTVHFSNLKQGLYDAVINESGNKVGEEIINITGTNHVLSLGINLATQKSNPLMKKPSWFSRVTSSPIFIIGILIIGIILGIFVTFITAKLLGRKKG